MNQASLKTAPSGYRVVAEKFEPEIYLYGTIDRWGEISAARVRDDLRALGQPKTIHVFVNSEGGSVFEGLAIYSLFDRHPARIVMHVDGIALSMASALVMAGDEIVMAEDAWMMIHNPVGDAFGTAEEMHRFADLMDRWTETVTNIYVRQRGLAYETVADVMSAETWFTAEEAVAKGFADRVGQPQRIAANFDPARYSNVPANLCTQRKDPSMSTDESTLLQTATLITETRAATLEEIRNACPGAEAEFLLAQLDRKATVDAAQRAYAVALEAKLKAAQGENEKLRAEAERVKAEGAQPKRRGFEPLPEGGKKAAAGNDDPVVRFSEAVRDEMKSFGLSRLEAVKRVCRRDPELHHAYLAAANSQSPRVQALIAERFSL